MTLNPTHGSVNSPPLRGCLSGMFAALDYLSMGASSNDHRSPADSGEGKELQDLGMLPISALLGPLQDKVTSASDNRLGDDQHIRK